MSIYFGNLPYDVNESEIREICAQFGTVAKVILPIDKMTNRKKGFGFVTMSSEDEETAVINAFGTDSLGNSKCQIGDRNVRVSKAENNGEGGSGGSSRPFRSSSNRNSGGNFGKSSSYSGNPRSGNSSGGSSGRYGSSSGSRSGSSFGGGNRSSSSSRTSNGFRGGDRKNSDYE